MVPSASLNQSEVLLSLLVKQRDNITWDHYLPQYRDCIDIYQTRVTAKKKREKKESIRTISLKLKVVHRNRSDITVTGQKHGPLEGGGGGGGRGGGGD